tara:strand:+ start:3522 stop:4073 length:552 start_codon:yes stop_codon:yes gene_type:complete
MTNISNASSNYEVSLPVSSDAILNLLEAWKIPFNRTDHAPLHTVEEAKKFQSQFLSPEEGGGHIKNLYLRDNKKRNILLVVEQDTKINLKTLHKMLEVGRLSFGSSERLMENLGVRPGAVTPLSMITGRKKGVQLFIDSDLKDCKQIYVHPLVNDRTIALTLEGLETFFDKIKITPYWIKLEK